MDVELTTNSVAHLNGAPKLFGVLANDKLGKFYFTPENVRTPGHRARSDIQTHFAKFDM